MELLTLTHQDFTLRIECGNFDRIWSKATRNVSQESLTCKYRWNPGVKRVSFKGELLWSNDGRGFDNGGSVDYEALFFDNCDYPVWVDFNGDDVSSAFVATFRQQDYENFAYHAKKHVLSGFLNYGNDIGKAELVLHYTKSGREKIFRLGYEVLSSKLDYHAHWRDIMKDIEAEYRMLTIDFLKRTYHGFEPSTQGETPDAIWWSLLKDKQSDLLKWVRLIINRPKQRLKDTFEYNRADQLRKLTPSTENLLAEHRKDVGFRYRVAVPQLNHDTIENRFLKHVLQQIARKHDKLGKEIESHNDVSVYLKQEIAQTRKDFDQLLNNRFFRGVGKFKGLNQESLTLQRATGYYQVLRIWLLLNKVYSLHEGLYKLESKDIATLYEIWCFIEMQHIVKKLLEDEQGEIVVDQASRTEMNSYFTFELPRGSRSRVIFRKGDVEIAELMYNTSADDDSNLIETGMSNVVSRTVPQRPDIVLQLSKYDILNGIKLTYLFDAKYRIEKDRWGHDVPPNDAINQMHRYRDALFYNDISSHGEVVGDNLKREVIGGYILFPGSGEPLEVQQQRFFKSIEEVNIGAFPLRPKDSKNRELLENFVNSLITKGATQILGTGKIIPQRGLTYEMTVPPKSEELIMVGYYRSKEHLDCIIKKKIYNARSDYGMKDAIELVPGFEKAKLLVLHGPDKEVHIYPLAKKSPVVISGRQLKQNIFKTDDNYLPLSTDQTVDYKEHYYLCFHIKSSNEVIIDGVNGIEDLMIPSWMKTRSYFAKYGEVFKK